MTRAATDSARSIGLHGILKAATYALELIAVAVAYFGLAVSGPLIPWINPTATPLWPPTGLALALVLLRGYRIWPAIFVGAFFATLAGSGSLSEAACIALGTPVAALAGAWLINRWSHGRDTFATPLGVAKFALIAFAPTAMISATAAIAGLVLANDAGLAEPRRQVDGTLAGGRRRNADHRSRHRALGDQAVASLLAMEPVGDCRRHYRHGRHRRRCL